METDLFKRLNFLLSRRQGPLCPQGPLSVKQFIQSSKRPYELRVFTQCVRAKHARPVLSTRPKIREERVAITHAPLASEGSGAERLRMRTDYLSCA